MPCVTVRNIPKIYNTPTEFIQLKKSDLTRWGKSYDQVCGLDHVTCTAIDVHPLRLFIASDVRVGLVQFEEGEDSLEEARPRCLLSFSRRRLRGWHPHGHG